jgi:hypothetical protein
MHLVTWFHNVSHVRGQLLHEIEACQQLKMTQPFTGGDAPKPWHPLVPMIAGVHPQIWSRIAMDIYGSIPKDILVTLQ